MKILTGIIDSDVLYEFSFSSAYEKNGFLVICGETPAQFICMQAEAGGFDADFLNMCFKRGLNEIKILFPDTQETRIAFLNKLDNVPKEVAC